MPSPTPLGSSGFLGAGFAYSGGSSVTSPVTFTTTADIPASTLDSPVALFVVCIIGPDNYEASIHPGGNNGAIYTITDAATDPGGFPTPNTYTAMGSGLTGGMHVYGFGIPATSSYPGFEIGEIETAIVGGSSSWTYACVPTRPIPSGTTVTVAFPAGGDPPATWMSATLVGWLNADPPESSSFCCREIAPTSTDQGSGGFVPLGDWLISDLVPSTSHAGWAFVWACDCFGSLDDPTICSGTVIDGSQTPDDSGGQWTKVDHNGGATVSGFGGLVYSVFTIDGATADLTQVLDQWTITGASEGNGYIPSGFIGYSMLYDHTEATTNYPVFNSRFRAGSLASSGSGPIDA